MKITATVLVCSLISSGCSRGLMRPNREHERDRCSLLWILQLEPALSSRLQSLKTSTVHADMVLMQELNLEARLYEGINDFTHRMVPTIFHSPVVCIGYGIRAL